MTESMQSLGMEWHIPDFSRAALKHGIRNPESGNRKRNTESNINDRKLKNFTLHNFVQSKENLSEFLGSSLKYILVIVS